MAAAFFHRAASRLRHKQPSKYAFCQRRCCMRESGKRIDYGRAAVVPRAGGSVNHTDQRRTIPSSRNGRRQGQAEVAHDRCHEACFTNSPNTSWNLSRPAKILLLPPSIGNWIWTRCGASSERVLRTSESDSRRLRKPLSASRQKPYTFW